MKRYGYLYKDIIDIENIKKAILKASKGKINRKNVVEILNNIDDYAYQLQDLLVNKTYIPSSYTVRHMFNDRSHKERIIKSPKFFPDQCIHWCLMLILSPILQKRMYKYTCSAVRGRGTHYAKKYVHKAMKNKKKTKYCYKLDIRHFYQSIDNEVLKEKFRRIFKDPDLIWLIDTIIDTDEGLPIGTYTSQWFSNFYLNDLDHYIKEELKIKKYARYADDMVVFHSNKRKLRLARLKIEKKISSDNISIKPNWTLFKVKMVDFVGYKIYRDHIAIRKRTYLRMMRRIRKLTKRGWLSLRDCQAMISYWGFILHSNSYKLYHNKIKPILEISKCKNFISQAAKNNDKETKLCLT